MTGRLVGYGTYIPAFRLSRAGMAGGRGNRAIAAYDEDTTSLAVEAGRRALSATPGCRPTRLAFATTLPAYADRTNATAVHAALGLAPSAAAYDMIGAVRSTLGAMRAICDGVRPGAPALLVAADIRTGLPGSADERDGGDGAAALLFASDGPCVAEVLAHSVATEEIFDRWRVPGEIASKVWEERFGETALVPLARDALSDALKTADLRIDDVDRVIVTGTNARAIATVRRDVGDSDKVTDDRMQQLGNSGAAHPWILLADVLERSAPGELIMLLVLADGAECIVFRAGELAGAFVPTQRVDAQIDGLAVSHEDAMVWRGILRREPPRRPDPDRPAAPPTLRNAAWKFAFVGGRCMSCGTRHLPAERVCLRCGRVDVMEPEPLAGLQGRIVTFAVDHLAFSVAPPVVVAVVDFDGGGRLQCEVTDVDPTAVAVGDRVELTFRRLYTTADGVHDYFWKVRPARTPNKEG
jgi:hydroxymethylglutaryl-CoA synthase